MSVTSSSLARQLRAIVLEKAAEDETVRGTLAAELLIPVESVDKMLKADPWELSLATSCIDALGLTVRVAH